MRKENSAVRLANPRRERIVGTWLTKYEKPEPPDPAVVAGCALFGVGLRQPNFTRRAIRRFTGRTHTLGNLTEKKLRLQNLSAGRRKKLPLWSPTRMGLAMGYGVMQLMPLRDLRHLHRPQRHNKHLRGYHKLPKGVPAKDLAAINLYLESVGIAPCPFPLLLKRGVWHNGAWRELAKQSVLYGCLSPSMVSDKELVDACC
jgi:hypothetical protein